MKRRITEQSVIFLSILKWFVLATTVGLLVGLSTTVFLKTLNWSIGFTNLYSYFFLLLPLALFLSAAIIQYLAPEAAGHGTEKVIEAVHKNSGKIRAMVVPVKLVATVLTIAAGGSVGKEGPCAQIGGGIASSFADLLRLGDRDRRKLVICGISAGFSTVFGTPLAGALFGVEVLFMGGLLYDVLLPSFIAGIIGYQVSSALGVNYFYHPLNFVPVFHESFFIKVALAGIFFGCCSLLLIEVLKLGHELSKKIRLSAPLKGCLGGLILIGMTLVFSKRYLGLGLETIQASLGGESIPWYAFILKSVFTSITLNFGGSGGIVTPIFFVGSTAGTVFADVLNLDIATFSAIGFVALLAGAANTPISASIMAVELFGPEIAPYAAVACVISFLMTGHRSVYPSQILAIKKSESIDVELGKEIEKVIPQFQLRPKSLTGALIRLIRAAKEKVRAQRM